MNFRLPTSIPLIFASFLVATSLLTGCKNDTPPAEPVPVGPGTPETGTSTSTPGTHGGSGKNGEREGVGGGGEAGSGTTRIEAIDFPPVGFGDFSAAQDMAKIATEHFDKETYVVEGNDGWLFLAKELRFLGHSSFTGDAAVAASRAAKKEWADPIPAILDFNEQLKARGINLLVVPVPPKANIYADKLMSAEAGKRYDLALATFYENLREEGVDVLDLTDAFIGAREQAPMHCKTDTHWTPQAIELTADLIHKHVADVEGLAGTKTYGFRELESDHIGDLSDMLGRDDIESLTVRRVVENRKPIADDDASPILVMGDSHVQFCDSPDFVTVGAGLGDHLAQRFGQPVATISNRGSGTTVVRSALLSKPPEFLEGKKLVVWCFAARDFTESSNGWRQLPISK